MGDMFAAAGLPIVADKRPDEQFFMRSDNIAFARRGHPRAHAVDLQPARRLSPRRATSVAHRLRAHDGGHPRRRRSDAPAGRRPGAAVESADGRPVGTTTPQPHARCRCTRRRSEPSVERLARYTTVKLEADTSALTARERRMLPLLIDAAREMNGIYWMQAYR